MFKPFALVASGTALFCTTGWLAADEAPASTTDNQALFAQLDANQDGLLADDEIPAERKMLFGRLLRIGDKNTDGKLSAEEFGAALKGDSPADGPASGDKSKDGKASSDKPAADAPGPGRLFARLDANGDGKITADEVPAEGRERFEKLIQRADKDGDGAITQREFLQGLPRPEAGVAPAGIGPAALKGKGPGQPGREIDPAQIFKRMDVNGDGKVTVDEVPEQRRQGVERLIQRGDKNNDQALSAEELRAIFSRRAKPNGDDQPAGKQASTEKTAEVAEAKVGETIGAAKVPVVEAKAVKKPGKKEAKQAQAAKLGIFLAVDKDRDGTLSGQEIDGASEAIRKLDKDGDGTISPNELMAGAKKKKDKQP